MILFGEKAKAFRLAAIVILAAGIIHCGGPQIRHTAINGEVRDIQAWSLKIDYSYTPPENIARESNDIDLQRLEQYYDERARQFADDISAELQSRGFITGGNIPGSGIIAIKIDWRREVTPPAGLPDLDSLKNSIEERKRLGQEVADSVDVNLSTLYGWLTGKSPKIEQIEVDLYTNQDLSLGRLFIEDKGHSIKPEKVAEILAKLMTEGTY